MTKSLSFIASVIVATALALPPAVEAQASRRGGSDTGSSGGSRGGSGSSGGTAVPRATPSAPRPAPSEGEVRPARPSGTNRPASSRPTATGPRASSPRSDADVAAPAAMRVRDTQAIRGVAQPRGSVENPQHPFSPWGRWYPWYSYGSPYWSSYGYGHVIYSPYLFGGTLWSWNRYGWHAPYLYDPYGYVSYTPYYWPSTDTSAVQDEGLPTGSLRLRVTPETARVYVDGALAGVAEEFGGLGNHLAVPAGRRELEFRAEGYETLSMTIDVRAGRTQTERIKLVKQP